jgi:protein phosphatase
LGTIISHGEQGVMSDIVSYAKTDIGYRRKNNEDSFLIIDDTKIMHNTRIFGKMFLVADGMGGHAAGEVASKMACEGMSNYYLRKPDDVNFSPSPEMILNRLETVIHNTNREIYRHGQINRDYRGMGTTLSVLILFKTHALIGHVGDSRIYRQRDGSLEQITVDHTEVQALVDMGHLTDKQASVHPYRNILLQALGVSETLEKVFTRIEEVKSGDIFLLSSDGLHDLVLDMEIQKTLCDHPVPESAGNHLVQLALENGGKDNITVVVVRILETGSLF